MILYKNLYNFANQIDLDPFEKKNLNELEFGKKINWDWIWKKINEIEYEKKLTEIEYEKKVSLNLKKN